MSILKRFLQPSKDQAESAQELDQSHLEDVVAPKSAAFSGVTDGDDPQAETADQDRGYDALSEAIGDLHRQDPRLTVSWGVRVGAEWAWRIVILLLATGLVLWGVSKLTSVVVPFMISLLFTAMLLPLVRLMRQKLRFPPALAAAVALLLGLGTAGLVLSFSISQIVMAAPDLAARSADGFTQVMNWLTEGPLKLQEQTVNAWVDKAVNDMVLTIKANASAIASGAFVYAASIAEIVTAGITVLFCLFFFLKDGRQIWLWVVRLMPARARRPLNEGATKGWQAVGSWSRVQVLVAAIDALGIGLGAYFLGTSLWIPIALFTFLMTFIPILGAILAGAVAVLVILVEISPTSALIMLLVVLVVQQLEGNVLNPLLMSNAVSLHPMAVVLGVMAGGYLLGIVGALFAVPVMAFFNESGKRLASYKAYQNRSGIKDEELGLKPTHLKPADA